MVRGGVRVVRDGAVGVGGAGSGQQLGPGWGGVGGRTKGEGEFLPDTC